MAFKIGFIGAGNMGGALALAAAKSSNEIFISDVSNEKAQDIANKCGAKVLTTKEIIDTCDYVFLGVKPQVLPTLLKDVKTAVNSRKEKPTLISMAAGVALDTITAALGEEAAVLRIMPNLPVMLGKGVILICKNGIAANSDIDNFCEFMANSGKIIPIEEKFIDAASAISGCGPAFVYMFIEALSDGGVNCGLTSSTALELAAQTLIGAAEMVLKGDKHPAKLRNDVCSPGGTTIEGVRTLEEHNFRAATMDAVISAYKRTKELAK